MRGAWIVACAIAVAGCNNVGIVIEVRTHPSVATKNVELFLGLEQCHDCPAIRSMGATGALAGEVYFRDGDESFLGRVDSSGSAFFQIRPSDLGYYLKTVVAVSAEQDAAAIIFDVDASTGEHWVMQLQPATPALHVQGEDDGQFVEVWHQTKLPSSSCIAFESWKQGQLTKRTFVVPKLDPDCDDFTEESGECAALEWGSSVPPRLDAVSCVATDATDPAKPYCALGGQACIDGQPPGMGTCAPSDYCVPSAMCNQCATSTNQPACVADLFRTSGLLAPKLACTLPITLHSSGAFYVPCSNSNRFEFDSFEDKIAQCKSLELAERPTLMNGIGPFEDRVALNTMNTMTMRSAELKVRGLTQNGTSCTFDMEWSGEIADAEAGGTSSIVAPLSVMSLTPTVDPGAAEKHLLMPLSVVFTKNCSLPPSCAVSVDLAEDIYNCAPVLRQPMTLTFGERPGTTYSNVTKDTFIDLLTPMTPHGSAETMQLQSGGAREAIGLLRFDLTAIPMGSLVTSVRLHLSSATNVSNLQIFRITEAWGEDATYQERLMGVPWTAVNPPSRDPVAVAGASTSAPGAFSFALQAGFVQEWINAPQIKNHGMALVFQGATQLVLNARENTVLSSRPMLEVTFTPPP